MNIGFIGLGIMGAPMARHLMDAGHKLFLKSRRSVPAELRGAGGFACDSAANVARKSDIIFLMLPDTPDVATVLFGEEGVSAGLASGKTVVDMSSISPIETKGFAARVADRGCAYLDAPVSGGEVGAKNATLSIMVGGTPKAFARVKPLFDLIGKTVTHVGPNGSGQIAKVANQIIVALTIEAVAEGLTSAPLELAALRPFER